MATDLARRTSAPATARWCSYIEELIEQLDDVTVDDPDAKVQVFCE